MTAPLTIQIPDRIAGQAGRLHEHHLDGACHPMCGACYEIVESVRMVWGGLALCSGCYAHYVHSVVEAQRAAARQVVEETWFRVAPRGVRWIGGQACPSKA